MAEQNQPDSERIDDNNSKSFADKLFDYLGNARSKVWKYFAFTKKMEGPRTKYNLNMEMAICRLCNKSYTNKEKIVDGWERTETDSGVPYFVNHHTESTSWDHPYWTKIVEDLQEHDCVKYAAYRTALKVYQLQKNLQLHNIELITIQHSFEDLGYTVGSWESMTCADLMTLLISIFSHTHGQERRPEESEMLADLSLNLLLNLFDKNKTGVVPVMSTKITLCLLSSASLKEKYRYFYQELHDPSTYIGTHALKFLLEALMKMPDFLHESLSFGRTPEPAVASCAQMGKASGGITEDVFYRWLQKELQTLVWLPTLHRVLATQNVSHEVKCSVCKTYPIIGLRYKCLKCFKFNMCQSCFFMGKIRKKHKTKHPTQEYCTNSTAKDDTAAFMKTLKNNLSRKQKNKSCKYLPIEADSQYTNLAWSPGKDERDGDIHEDISTTARKLAELEEEESESQSSPEHTPEDVTTTHHPTIEHLSPISPKEDGLQKQRDELNAVIVRLEEENRALYEQLTSLQEYSDTDSLGSDNNYQLPARPRPNLQHFQSAFRETQNLPIREPLPCEATPIFLSVPIVHVKSYHSNSCSPKSSDSAPSGTFPQPDFSTLDSSHTTYPTHITPPRVSTLTDSLDALDASPANFSIPSPSKSCDEFNCEEAELRDIVDEADRMFPKDLSFGRPTSSESTEEDEMLRAANSITQAMSEFVNQAVNPAPLPSLDLILPE